MLMHLKKVAARLPERWQCELKRLYYARKIRKGAFETYEPEYGMLPDLVNPGDWVIDIGANIGQYTKRLSDLVGAHGRVIAFEPVPAAFSLLSANTQLFGHTNVSLFNAAVSDCSGIAGMSMPAFSTGLPNYCEARLVAEDGEGLSVLTISLDALDLRHRVSLVKIDVEGHERSVLAGMRGLIAKDHPILIVETDSREVMASLDALGYIVQNRPDSPNILCMPQS